ncbi:MAG TPA: hypothetical protein PLQ35_14440 [bacterium]|nr:hypothetical protein [bacterium]
MATRQDDSLVRRLNEFDRRERILTIEQRLLESEKRELILATDGELRRYELSALERRANAPVAVTSPHEDARVELRRLNAGRRERELRLTSTGERR